MSNTRDQIIHTTCELIEKQGYHATGLNEIVQESGAPKGSLYYYFPEGKDQITAEAIEWAGRMIAERVEANLQPGVDPAEAIGEFVRGIAYHVEASGYCSGGPLQTVALETATTNERINQACRAAYDRLQSIFQARLRDRGATPEQALRLGIFINAAIEGAILLSRTYHSGDPLRLTADYLQAIIQKELA